MSGEPKRYVLHIGKPGAARHAQPVTVQETPEAFVLRNGVLEVTVNRRKFRLFDRVILDRNRDGQFAEDETIVQAVASEGPYGKPIVKGEINRKALGIAPHKAMRVTVPADGKTGQYTLRFGSPDRPIHLVAPLSGPPGEIYVVRGGRSLTATFLYLRTVPG